MNKTFFNRKRNKARQNESAYTALIASPGNLSGGHYVLANAEFAYSCSTPAAIGSIHCYVYGEPVRDLPCPALAAGQIQRIGYVERGLRISFSDGIITLYLVRNNGTMVAISMGDFT